MTAEGTLALVIAALVLGVLAALALLVYRHHRRTQILLERLRVRESAPVDPESLRRRGEEGPGESVSLLLNFLMIGFLARLYAPWMRKIGFRSPHAAAVYVLSKIVLMGAVVAALFLTPSPYNPVVVRTDVPLVALVSAAGVWILLDLVAVSKIRRRRLLIETDIPFWLDLHATLVEGGMGFDQALSRFVAETELFKRPLFVELRYMYQEMNLGLSRLEALRSMSSRIDVETLDTVVAAIVQGDQIGGGIIDTLRAQADMMRNKVFEEARERAQKLPVKLLFPMVVGILPSLFLVTVAPSFLRLLGVFEGEGIG